MLAAWLSVLVGTLIGRLPAVLPSQAVLTAALLLSCPRACVCWCQLRRLHLSVFPTAYSDSFYKEAYAAAARPLTRLAYHNDILIGAVCARIDTAAGLTSDTHLRRLYIMTLGVLAPYRRHGIGTAHRTHTSTAGHTATARPEAACYRRVPSAPTHAHCVCAVRVRL